MNSLCSPHTYSAHSSFTCQKNPPDYGRPAGRSQHPGCRRNGPRRQRSLPDPQRSATRPHQPDISRGIRQARYSVHSYTAERSLQIRCFRIFAGTFYAVSFRTRLDTDDCVAVTPAGVLVLHLNKETYQTLGLEGRVSQFARKRNSKYGE